MIVELLRSKPVLDLVDCSAKALASDGWARGATAGEAGTTTARAETCGPVRSVDLRSGGLGRQRLSDCHLDGDCMARKHSDGRGRFAFLANLREFVDQIADCLLVSGWLCQTKCWPRLWPW